MSGLLVRDVVRDVVAEVAPDELVVVDGLAQFDDDTVVRRLARSGKRRDPLGFGVGEIAALVTPVVWLVLDEVAKQAAESAVSGAKKSAKSLLNNLRRREAPPVPVPALTTEQLAEVRRALLEAASRRGLEQERATAIADALIARLALASSATSVDPAEGDDDGSAGGAAAED